MLKKGQKPVEGHLTLSSLKTTVDQSKTMNGSVHCSNSVLKGSKLHMSMVAMLETGYTKKRQLQMVLDFQIGASIIEAHHIRSYHNSQTEDMGENSQGCRDGEMKAQRTAATECKES